MLGRVQLLVGTLVVAMMAGCAGSSDPGPNVIDDGEDGTGTAAIQGQVTNDEGLPIAGVQVATLPLERTVVTGEAGEFKLENLAAGTYQVFASKLGYESNARSVSVQEDETVTLDITLVVIAVDEVYHESIGPYNGHVACAYAVTPYAYPSCPASGTVWEEVFGEQTNTFVFEASQDNVWAVLGEMRWTQSVYATSEEFSMILTYDGGYGSNWWCQGVGSSPVTFLYHMDEDKKACDATGSGDDVEDPPNSEHELHLVALPDFHRPEATEPTSLPPNLSLGQQYETIVTIYYGEDPVLPYSAFPDA